MKTTDILQSFLLSLVLVFYSFACSGLGFMQVTSNIMESESFLTPFLAMFLILWRFLFVWGFLV